MTRPTFSSAPFASPSAPRALTAGERERRAKRVVKLRVSRGRRVHIFNTRLGREVQAVLEACRKELLDDKELGAELSLYREVRSMEYGEGASVAAPVGPGPRSLLVFEVCPGGWSE